MGGMMGGRADVIFQQDNRTAVLTVRGKVSPVDHNPAFFGCATRTFPGPFGSPAYETGLTKPIQVCRR